MTKKKLLAEKNPDGIPDPVDVPKGPDASPAAATLHPKAAGSDEDPKTKFERISAVIGNLAQRDDNAFEALWNDIWPTITAATQGKGDVSATNKASIAMHPSAAVGESVKTDLAKILEGQSGIDESVQTKISTLFEAAVEARMILATEQLEEQYANKLDEAIEQVIVDVSESVGEYIEVATNRWLEENEVAIESTLRHEIADNLLEAIKNVVVDANVVLPENQVDVVESLSEKLDQTERQLADAISENTEMRKALDEATKKDIVNTVSEGLTLVESEKFKELAENIDFDSIDEFKTKLETIKESQFVKDPKKSMITEDLEEIDESNGAPEKTYVNAEMEALAKALARMAPKK